MGSVASGTMADDRVLLAVVLGVLPSGWGALPLGVDAVSTGAGAMPTCATCPAVGPSVVCVSGAVMALDWRGQGADCLDLAMGKFTVIPGLDPPGGRAPSGTTGNIGDAVFALDVPRCQFCAEPRPPRAPPWPRPWP